MLSRDEIIAHLAKHLEADPLFLAGWLAGSDANGRADDISDVDLMLIVENGNIEAGMARVEEIVAMLSPIKAKYRMPPATGPLAFPQQFLQLENAPEDLMVDYEVLERTIEHPWFEIERHGTPQVLFDREGLIVPVNLDQDEHKKKVAEKIEDIGKKYPIFRHIPIKCAKRGLPADAAYFYLVLTMRYLVDLARCVHCPDRYDFGWRYLNDDLPKELHDKIAELSYPPSMEAIPEYVERAQALIEELLAEATPPSNP